MKSLSPCISMSKFTCIQTNMAIEPQLEVDKIIDRKPTQKLILSNNLGFKNSSYLNKQRKNTASIIREAKIMAIVRPKGAGNSDESLVFSCETSHKKYPYFQRFKALLVMNRFWFTRKLAKDQINIDFLYLADRIEHFLLV